MVNKKIKKINLSTEERHFGVVLENIDSKLDLVVEGHKSLDKKIDGVDQKLEEFSHNTDYKFKVLTEMTAKNTENIEVMKSDIEIIKNSLKKKVDLEEFEILEKRVLLLENKVARGRV
jgi:peptidoglycan hydrolase CwlO-like protein